MKKDIQLLILLIIIGIVYFYFVKKKSKKITNILCLVAIVFFSAKIFHDNFFKSTIEGVQNMQSDEQKLKTLKAMNTFLKDTLVKKSGVQTTQKNEIAKIADTAKNIGDHVENLFGANQNEFAAAIKYLNLDEKDENIKIIEGFNNNDKKIVKKLVNNIKTSVNKLFNILQTLIVPNSRLNEHDSTNNSIHKEIAILRSLYARDNIVLCENIKNNMPIFEYEYTKEWAQDNGYEVIKFEEDEDTEEINGTPPGAFKVKNNKLFPNNSFDNL